MSWPRNGAVCCSVDWMSRSFPEEEVGDEGAPDDDRSA